MCIQWTCVLYSVVITLQSNPPISEVSRTCNEFTSVWSMFPCNKKKEKERKYENNIKIPIKELHLFLLIICIRLT